MRKLQLRSYQTKLTADIYTAWEYVPNVLAVLPTGGGKTVLFSNIISQHRGASCAIAHRSELISQMSLALAKFGIKHRVIGGKALIRWVSQLHAAELGRVLYDPNASCAVASVDTLVKRVDQLKHWCQQVTLWVTDEAHHLLKSNKWGKAADMFPYARGLGVTATPTRADGKGLGRYADGILDMIVEGPNMRDLINQEYLTDYRIFAPPNNLDLSSVNISRSGDYNPKQLKTAVRRSQIVGDVVQHYLRITPEKLGVTFVTDVETASDVANQYRANGIPAEVVSAKTPEKIRTEVARRFKRREILQIVNVDIYGEGVDIPALEVVSMARPTESYVLYSQQFGRALRTMEGKQHAVIIDHVGNVARHGLPDRPHMWTLARRERRNGKSDPNLIPVRTCRQCTGVYEAIFKKCPYCGLDWVPAQRSTPEQVDGDLLELDPNVLAALRGEIARIDKPAEQVRVGMEKYHGPGIAAMGAAKQHRLRQEAQEVLREGIATYGGAARAAGISDDESYRRFYFRYGVDVLTAQTLGRPEAEALNEKIRRDLA